MKKLILFTFILNILLISKVTANDYYLLMWEPSDAINKYALMKVNQTDGSEVELTSIQLDSGLTTDDIQCDTYVGKCFVHQNNVGYSSDLNVYDIKTDTWSVAKKSNYQYTYGIQPYPHFGQDLIRKETDGSIHIGENSLVTQEVSGVQDLYATDSTSSQIDINIKSGTNLLIDGTNVMTSINNNTSNISTNTSNISTNTSNIGTNTSNISTNTSNIGTNTSNIGTNTSNISSMNNRINNLSNDISGSVALSSALSALPTSSPDSFYTCGIGAGVHDSSSALSAGCASEFANYAFIDHMPNIFQTASFNIGSSFLMNGEPDISDARDMSIKAGITFKFGAPKPLRKTKKGNSLLENKIDAVMAKNETIKAENDLLKAQIAEINIQLKALNMLAMN